MECIELLDEARNAGLQVVADGDRLVVRGPKHAEPLARQLLGRKAEVLALLRGIHPPLDRVHSVHQPAPEDTFPISTLLCPICQGFAYRYPSGRVECQHPDCGTLSARPAFTCQHCGGTQAYYPGKTGAVWGPAYCSTCGQRED